MSAPMVIRKSSHRATLIATQWGKTILWYHGSKLQHSIIQQHISYTWAMGAVMAAVYDLHSLWTLHNSSCQSKLKGAIFPAFALWCCLSDESYAWMGPQRILLLGIAACFLVLICCSGSLRTELSMEQWCTGMPRIFSPARNHIVFVTYLGMLFESKNYSLLDPTVLPLIIIDHILAVENTYLSRKPKEKLTNSGQRSCIFKLSVGKFTN